MKPVSSFLRELATWPRRKQRKTHINMRDSSRPWVEQQVVEAGLDDALPPLSVLIRLVKLLAQSLLVSLAIRQLEGPQGPTQFWTITYIYSNKIREHTKMTCCISDSDDKLSDDKFINMPPSFSGSNLIHPQRDVYLNPSNSGGELQWK